MNKSGIEVHELQRPRPRKRKAKNLDDVEPISPTDAKWILGSVLGTALFWCAVIWWFA